MQVKAVELGVGGKVFVNRVERNARAGEILEFGDELLIEDLKAVTSEDALAAAVVGGDNLAVHVALAVPGKKLQEDVNELPRPGDAARFRQDIEVKVWRVRRSDGGLATGAKDEPEKKAAGGGVVPRECAPECPQGERRAEPKSAPRVLTRTAAAHQVPADAPVDFADPRGVGFVGEVVRRPKIGEEFAVFKHGINGSAEEARVGADGAHRFSILRLIRPDDRPWFDGRRRGVGRHAHSRIRARGWQSMENAGERGRATGSKQNWRCRGAGLILR